MKRTANPAPKINIGDRSPAWTGTGCYVSPVPVKAGEEYDRQIGDYRYMRRHVFTTATGAPAYCNPALCRECERERTWHDHGEVDA